MKRLFLIFIAVLLTSMVPVAALENGDVICGVQFENLKHVFTDSTGIEILSIDSDGDVHIRGTQSSTAPGNAFVGVKFIHGTQTTHSMSSTSYYIDGSDLAEVPTTKGIMFYGDGDSILLTTSISGDNYFLGVPVFSGRPASCDETYDVCTAGNIYTETHSCSMETSEGECETTSTPKSSCENICTDSDDNEVDPYKVQGVVEDYNPCVFGDNVCPPPTIAQDTCKAGTASILQEYICINEEDMGTVIEHDCGTTTCTGNTKNERYCANGRCYDDEIDCTGTSDRNGNGIACDCDCTTSSVRDVEEVGQNLCDDSIDNDCDGTAGYIDNTVTGLLKDQGCSVTVETINVQTTCPTELTSVMVECKYMNIDYTGIAETRKCAQAKIETPTGENTCTFIGWSGDGAEFSCGVGSFTTPTGQCGMGEGYTVTCTVSENCIRSGVEKTQELYSMPGDSSGITNQGECESAGYYWCAKCDQDNKWNQQTGDVCVVSQQQCQRVCSSIECNSNCDTGIGSAVEGSSCKYDCDLNTCQFTESCSMVNNCQDDIARQNIQCTDTGCTYTEDVCNNYEEGLECWPICSSGDIYTRCNDWVCELGSCSDSENDYTKTTVSQVCNDQCVETGDIGNQPNVKGSVIDYNKCTTTTTCPSTAHEDTCIDNNMLTEWYSSGTSCNSVEVNCDAANGETHGYSCQSGACTNECDNDGDGWCENPYDGDGSAGTYDCNDNPSTGAGINPDAVEVCDAIDHDCVGGPYNGIEPDDCQLACNNIPGATWVAGQDDCCGDDVSENWCYGSGSCYNSQWFPDSCDDGALNCGEDPQSTTVCQSGDVYWVDECGITRALKQDCGYASGCSTFTCSSGTCVEDSNGNCDGTECSKGSAEYCTDCSHCGDGSCNCGETTTSCKTDCCTCGSWSPRECCPERCATNTCCGAYYTRSCTNDCDTETLCIENSPYCSTNYDSSSNCNY